VHTLNWVVTASFNKAALCVPSMRTLGSGSISKNEMVATDLIDTLHKVFPHAKIRLLNSKEQTTMDSLVHLILVLVQARKV
jgi:hypothetical protein